MGKINLSLGDAVRFSKTFAECDVYAFAGLTGDFSPNHTNEEFCKKTPFKTRIVHGCLTFGLTSTVAAMAAAKTGQTCLALGYDHVRFLKPVHFGDTITAVYTISGIDEDRMRFLAKCELYNQHGDLVLVCTNIQKVLDDPS